MGRADGRRASGRAGGRAGSSRRLASRAGRAGPTASWPNGVGRQRAATSDDRAKPGSIPGGSPGVAQGAAGGAPRADLPFLVGGIPLEDLAVPSHASDTFRLFYLRSVILSMSNIYCRLSEFKSKGYDRISDKRSYNHQLSSFAASASVPLP